MVEHRILAVCVVLAGGSTLECHQLRYSLVRVTSRLLRLVRFNARYFPSLPVGLFALPFMGLSGVLRQTFDAKYVLLGGLVLMVAGTAFLPFADYASRYWPVVFPGFMLGTAGATIVFATAK